MPDTRVALPDGSVVVYDGYRYRCAGASPVGMWVPECDPMSGPCPVASRDRGRYVSVPWYLWPAAKADCLIRYPLSAASGAAADVYSRVWYGDIPSPGSGLPVPPGAVPWSPELQAQAAAGGPVDSTGLPVAYWQDAAARFEQWQTDTGQSIQTAIDAGKYRPGGLLPGLSGETDWALLAMAVLGLLVLLKV